MPKVTRSAVEKAFIEEAARRSVRHQWPYPKDMDWLLAHVIHLVEGGSEFSITLNMSGQIIHGVAISGETYLNEMAAWVRRTSSSVELADMLAGRFEEFLPIYRPEAGKEDQWQPGPPNYIHLREARYLNGNVSSPNEGTLWRGRITSVDGFTYGSLRQSES